MPVNVNRCLLSDKRSCEIATKPSIINSVIMGTAMALIDLIAHGGVTKSDGSFRRIELQAATLIARDWLEAIALRFGVLLGEVLILERLDDIDAVFSEMPEDFILI